MCRFGICRIKGRGLDNHTLLSVFVLIRCKHQYHEQDMPEVIPIEDIHLLNQSNSNQLNTNKLKSNQILVFEERGKPEYPSKNFSEQSREPTNSAHL